jgi:hypothetical protein
VLLGTEPALWEKVLEDPAMLTAVLTAIGLIGGAIAWGVKRHDDSGSARRDKVSSEAAAAAVHAEKVRQAATDLRNWADADVGSRVPPEHAVSIAADGRPQIDDLVTAIAQKRSMSFQSMDTDQWVRDHARLVAELKELLNTSSSALQLPKEERGHG